MQYRALKSSRIKSATYFEDEKTLEIRFNNNSTYEYLGVPQMVFFALVNSKSPGTYFEQNIKKVYRCEKG